MWSTETGNNCLVLDFGTCITYDLIDSENKYSGGAISPGMQMRFRAMNEFTKSLPLINEFQYDNSFVGRTTDQSMISGVLNGITGEVEKFISYYMDKYHDLRVVFCGGDSIRFESMVKDPIFAAPNLVLVGLNSILSYNNEVFE